MSESNTRTQLWENVSELMRRRYGGENLTRLAKEARFGPGSATRLKEQKTSVGIDILDKLAKLFKVEPWELLAPGLATGSLPAKDSAPALGRGQAAASTGRQNALTEHMISLEIAVDGLASELRTAGRDALRKWAGKEASASEAAETIEALASATRALALQKKPPNPNGLPKAA